MFRITAVYPNTPGSRFDAGYYCARHSPFAAGLLGPHGLRSVRTTVGTAALDGGPPPFWTISEMVFDTRAAFDAAMAAVGEVLFADLPNYTDTTPILQASDLHDRRRNDERIPVATLSNLPADYIRNEMSDIGHLVALDEKLNHQIVDTFASVASSEQSWTEKIWSAIVRKDGGLGIDFGLGRYHNRGVMDGWAAVSRGSEQWTVRASRELRDDPAITNVGPLTYEVIEPLRKVRYALARNDQQPIAYDITFTGELPPFFEDRHKQRERDGFRIGSDVIRYHQIGVPSGWVEIEGERIEIRPEEWTEYRDHSWGTRLDVGAHNADVRPSSDFGDVKFGEGEFVLVWSPFMLVSPSGEKVAYHFYFMSKQGRIFYSSGYRNHPDGQQEKVARVRPELNYDDKTRRLLGGTVHFDMLQGGTHSVEVEVLGTSGVHLGPGLYLGFDGRKHGSWKGPLEIEGEKFANTLDIATLKRIRQLRDCPIRVTEGDAVGYGIMETIIHGEHPELGLTAANSLI